jgi:hypothetical protein
MVGGTGYYLNSPSELAGRVFDLIRTNRDQLDAAYNPVAETLGDGPQPPRALAGAAHRTSP